MCETRIECLTLQYVPGSPNPCLLSRETCELFFMVDRSLTKDSYHLIIIARTLGGENEN